MANLTELAKPFGEDPPKVGPPPANLEPSYMDGSCAPHVGINPGRDQDRSRVDERVAASYSYGGASSYEAESDSDVDVGG